MREEKRETIGRSLEHASFTHRKEEGALSDIRDSRKGEERRNFWINSDADLCKMLLRGKEVRMLIKATWLFGEKLINKW